MHVIWLSCFESSLLLSVIYLLGMKRDFYGFEKIQKKRDIIIIMEYNVEHLTTRRIIPSSAK